MSTISNITVMSLQALQRTCWQNSEDKGFHDNEPTDPAQLAIYNGNRLMLIVSEAAEALEEIRSGRAANETYYDSWKLPHSLVAEVGVQRAQQLIDQDNEGKLKKPEGVPSELADVVIRCFDFAGSNGFDLGRIIQEKLAYNSTREPMHGKEVLMKFRLGDTVRVIDRKSLYWDQTGRITTIDKTASEGLPFHVTGLHELTPLWFGPRELILAEQEQP